jgi:hypothetical protein
VSEVWRTVADIDHDVTHVVREAVADDHLLSADCPCDPELQLRDREDGSVGSIFVHLNPEER